MMVPGFIDSHVHIISAGRGLAMVKLRDASTPAEFIARIKAYAKTVPKGAWITDGDWDHTLLGRRAADAPVDRLGDAGQSGVGEPPRRPHGARQWTGARGREGLEGDAGGRRRRHRARQVGRAHGAPQGQRAGAHRRRRSRIRRRRSPIAPSTPRCSYLAERGVTSAQNMGTWYDLSIFERAHKDGRMITRMYAVVPLATWEKLRDTVTARGHGDEWVRIGGLKGFVDGSLGSHTAAMLRPFDDAPKDSGLLVTIAREPVRAHVGRGQGRAARDGARDRRPRDPHPARQLRARREGERRRRTAASASSTRSTSRPRTCRASARSA